MAEIGQITPSTDRANASKTDVPRLSDALTFAWVILVVVGLGAPPLLFGTVTLGDGWTIFAPAMEAGLRWSFDQLPHIDYHTQTGPAYWLAHGIGAEIVGLQPKSVLVTNLLSAVPILLTGLYLTRPRGSGLMSAVFLTGVALLLLSLRPFGEAGGTIGHIGGPDRTALAIAAILFVTFFLEPRTERRPLGAALESILVAALVVWLVFLDAYIAAIVVLSGIVALAFPSASRGAILEGMTFAALACVGLGFLYGVGLPYLSDIKAGVAAAPLFRVESFVEQIQANAIPLAVVIVALGLAVLINIKNQRFRSDTIGVTVVLVLAGMLAINRIDTGVMPFTFTILIVLAARSYLNLRKNSQKSVFRMLGKIVPAYLPALIAALIFVALQAQADIATLTRYVEIQRAPDSANLCEAVDVPICTLRMTGRDDMNGHLFPSPVMATGETAAGDPSPTVSQAPVCAADADCPAQSAFAELVSQLNMVIQSEDRPMLLGVTNPLPYVYGVTPPRQTYSVLAPGRTISLKQHPSADWLFSDVSLLAAPKSATNPYYNVEILRLYEGGMTRMFDVVAETDMWTILRRKPIS